MRANRLTIKPGFAGFANLTGAGSPHRFLLPSLEKQGVEASTRPAELSVETIQALSLQGGFEPGFSLWCRTISTATLLAHYCLVVVAGASGDQILFPSSAIFQARYRAPMACR